MKSTKDIPKICNVDIERYLGKWYEIARMPHSFENGMENVTAEYSRRVDGKIEVKNSGVKDRKKKTAKAVAWVPVKSCTGSLLVRFFWPFKSGYNIIKLDEENYSYAVVAGNTTDYLWILSRKPEISDDLYDELVYFVCSKGFDQSKIIKVKQNW